MQRYIHGRTACLQQLQTDVVKVSPLILQQYDTFFMNLTHSLQAMSSTYLLIIIGCNSCYLFNFFQVVTITFACDLSMFYNFLNTAI